MPRDGLRAREGHELEDSTPSSMALPALASPHAKAAYEVQDRRGDSESAADRTDDGAGDDKFSGHGEFLFLERVAKLVGDSLREVVGDGFDRRVGLFVGTVLVDPVPVRI